MSIDLTPLDEFVSRHIGPSEDEISDMLAALGLSSLDELVDLTVPKSIRLSETPDLPDALGESALLQRLKAIAGKNDNFRSFIGMGYYDTITPNVILRNVLENPGWYTQYTPYQAEIAQGRLEALLNFQTMIIDLTGLEVSNASLLDEATACAEAMTMVHRKTRDKNTFFVSDACHPQNIALIQTRAEPLGINVVVGDHRDVVFSEDIFGALLQYPDTNGEVPDYTAFCEAAHAAGAYVIVSADLLSLTLLTPPGEFGADVAVGSTQRFGIPLGFGGPHAAYISAGEDFKRILPGRIIGLSKDAQGNPALRMALQTREQHIRRDKATSNICTAQVLLAVMAGMYAVYHGPNGLRNIAARIRNLTRVLAVSLEKAGYTVRNASFFDTLRIGTDGKNIQALKEAAAENKCNLRWFEDGDIGISLDEAATVEELDRLLKIFGAGGSNGMSAASIAASMAPEFDEPMARSSSYLTHPVFHSYRSETEMMRYLYRLQSRDLSLTTSMIPLGSCTMKLNAATEMIPVTWPEFGRIHPFAPENQTEGYGLILQEIEKWLAEITGFDSVSFQPNSGAQGEFAGLLTIRAYHKSRGDDARNICLIPSSAHGTNPASAVMAGMEVVVVKCDERGNIDVEDLRSKAATYADRLAALMVTYPSTHGVFEEGIRDICQIIHDNGGMVYMDGANLNAQVGLTNPGVIGADVCHLNLHKTFCIPHGGGGPGMGPIAVNKTLAPFLPGHPVVETGGEKGISAVSAAPYGSPSIVLISWAYIAMMGAEGLKRATQIAILNANYMANRLSDHYPVLYKGANGYCAHEFILDLRPFKQELGISDEDVAKRLMDYGFHAPTMSFPVAGTIMIEPTESESKAELDRFCDALVAIREEIEEVRTGMVDTADSMLRNAPHTAEVISADEWNRPYSRSRAAFPVDWLKEGKFWPSVGRIDNAFGDRNLVCACPPVEAYESAE